MTASNQTQQTPTPTPGPWTWGDDYRGLYGSGQDNEVLTYASYEGMWVSYGNKRDANAALIAAAPDLLAALQEIAREDAGGFYAAIANKALAKAGVTP